MCSYNWLSDSDLANIPIGRLANNGCLLAVWATNNERQLDMVNSVLFPAWHVTPVAQWFWLKVVVQVCHCSVCSSLTSYSMYSCVWGHKLVYVGG